MGGRDPLRSAARTILDAAIRAGDIATAVALAEKHVAVLHETMFVGLQQD